MSLEPKKEKKANKYLSDKFGQPDNQVTAQSDI